MEEQREIKMTEWAPYESFGKRIVFKCDKCDRPTGILQYRRVTNRDGEEHKEYRIFCAECGTKSRAYRSMEVARADFRAKFDKDELPKRRRKPTIQDVVRPGRNESKGTVPNDSREEHAYK